MLSTQVKNDYWLHEDELPPNPYYAWLTRPYVLSDAIQKVSQQLFSVQVLSQCLSPLETDEHAVHQASEAYLREVFLLAGEEPWVYARVSISTTCPHFLKKIEALGNRPIGVSLLYDNKTIERSAFQFRYHQNFCLGESKHHTSFLDQSIWARRSVFADQKTQLLVSEYFSPTIRSYWD